MPAENASRKQHEVIVSCCFFIAGIHHAFPTAGLVDFPPYTKAAPGLCSIEFNIDMVYGGYGDGAEGRELRAIAKGRGQSDDP